MALTIEERQGWLANLTLPQLMALAHHWGIPEYRTKTRDDLSKLLVRIEGVEVPVSS
jgi:hypothetical protein